MTGKNVETATWKRVVVIRTVIENIDDATTTTTMIVTGTTDEGLDLQDLPGETEVYLVTVIRGGDVTKTTTGRTEMTGTIGIENGTVNAVRIVKRAEIVIGTGSERKAIDTVTMTGIARGILLLIHRDVAGIEIVTVTRIEGDERPIRRPWLLSSRRTFRLNAYKLGIDTLIKGTLDILKEK